MFFEIIVTPYKKINIEGNKFFPGLIIVQSTYYIAKCELFWFHGNFVLIHCNKLEHKKHNCYWS